MAYTNIWNDAAPTGAEAANTIDDIFRSLKVDIEQRFIDIFAMPNFTDDPLRPYGLKFTDVQNAVISMGDNAGTPRSILWKNKAGAVTYATMSSTSLLLGTTMDFAVAATKAIFLDGGGDTKITESAANIVSFTIGGTLAVSLRATSIALVATNRIYLDGVGATGDTYIHESFANVLQFIVGGGLAMNLSSIGMTVGVGDIFLQTGQNITWGANNSVAESGGVLSLTASGTLGLKVTTAGIIISPLSATAVSVGTNDSGGAGFKLLRVPN